MPLTQFNISPLNNALRNRELVLTANNRLRAHILRSYSTESNTIETPRVFSLNQWISQSWQALQRSAQPESFKRVIDDIQRLRLWESIIASSPASSGLLQPEALAQTADSALRSMELWRLSVSDIESFNPVNFAQSNAQVVSDWIRQFYFQLEVGGMITEEQKIQILIDSFSCGDLPRDHNVHTIGFDDIPPLHLALIKAAGLHHHEVIAQVDETLLMRTETSTFENEIRSAAIWCKNNIESNSDSMCGVIVPNLGQCRQQVERIFTEVFEPLAKLPGSPRYTLPFNFSAGVPLGSTPIIAATIALLELNKPEWELDFICNFLMSPFWGDIDSEFVLRTHMVTALRKLNSFTITSTDFRHVLKKVSAQLGVSEEGNPVFTMFVQIEAAKMFARGSRSAQHWVDFFQAHLNNLGWPGIRRLDSQEHQQLVQWNELLDNFFLFQSYNAVASNLDEAKPVAITLSSAINQLRNVANKTPFQAKTPHSPIQILGALEGAGLQFSHCWVMGLHQHQWPPTPAPNPLLPIEMQLTHKMPHSSAERELEFALALTNHYSHCAPIVVFSSSKSDDDKELGPSALIRSIPLTRIEHLVDGVSDDARNYESIVGDPSKLSLEIVDTSFAPAFDLSYEPVRGGASIFKEQASCPFNAFARIRLGAETIPDPVAGFSPIERGNMIHEVMAHVWQNLKDQSALISMDDDELSKLTSLAAQKAVYRLKSFKGSSIGVRYSTIEIERLSKLAFEWLQQEKFRPKFSVIAIEQKVVVEMGGLPIQLRIDRIDQLESGDLILIDYKTGTPSTNSWYGDRMDEPQLPLYAITSKEKVGAISFAQVNAKAMRWLGTGELQIDHTGILPGHQEWNDQINEWSSQLNNLLHQFLSGDARVDMKDSKVAMYAEDLLPLNRLNEESLVSNYFSVNNQSNKIL